MRLLQSFFSLSVLTCESKDLFQETWCKRALKESDNRFWGISFAGLDSIDGNFKNYRHVARLEKHERNIQGLCLRTWNALGIEREATSRFARRATHFRKHRDSMYHSRGNRLLYMQLWSRVRLANCKACKIERSWTMLCGYNVAGCLWRSNDTREMTTRRFRDHFPKSSRSRIARWINMNYNNESILVLPIHESISVRTYWTYMRAE